MSTHRNAAVAIIILGRHIGYGERGFYGQDGSSILQAEGFLPNDGVELSAGILELDYESGILTTTDDEGNITSTVDVVALCSRIALADGALIGTQDPDSMVNESADLAQDLNTRQSQGAQAASAAQEEEKSEAHHFADSDMSQANGGQKGDE